jgi:hypothetical protein
LERHETGFQYLNRYGMKELGTLHGYFYFSGRLPVGIDFSTFGYEAYRESMARLSAGMKLSSHWALGVGLQGHWRQSELIERTSFRLSADFGLLYMAAEDLRLGFALSDFPRAYFLQAGCQWKLLGNLSLLGGLLYDKESRTGFGVGAEYEPFDAFFLRAGLRNRPTQPSFGLGYRFYGYRMDISAIYHSVLGVSLALGLAYSF